MFTCFERITHIPFVDQSTYSMKGFVKSRLIKMGVLTNASFNTLNAFWHSLFQENTTSLFVNSKSDIAIMDTPSHSFYNI
jgi:hypothetical protein